MAEPIGALRADLSANAAQFEKDMGRARKAVRNSSKSMQGSLNKFDKAVAGAIKTVFSWKAALAAVAGAVGLGLLIKRAIETADNIAKTARAIGVHTDTLQELRYAANLAGISTGALDGALTAFSKRVGEARAGTGTLVTILKKMSPTLLEQVKAAENVDQAFNVVVDAAAKMGNELDRNALLAAAFGRTAGVKMANMIGEGTAGIEKMRQEARELGLVLDSHMLKKAEEASDQLDRMSQILGVNLTRTLISLSPQIIALGDAFIKHIKPFTEWLISKLPDATASASELEKRIAALQERIATFNPGIGIASIAGNRNLAKMKEELSELNLLLVERQRREAMVTAAIVGGLDEQSQKIQGIRAELEYEREQLGRTEVGQQLYNLAKKAGIDVTNSYVDAIQPLIVALEAEKKAQKDAEKATKDATKKREQLESRGKSVTESVRTATEEYGASVTDLRELLDSGAISQDTFTRSVTAAKKKMDEASDSTKQNKELAKDLGMTFTSAFEDAVVSGGKLSDVLQGIEKDLIRLMLRRFVTQPLVGALEGVNFGSLFGDGGGNGFVNTSGIMDTSGFAHGGMHKGGFRIVGEQGPELEATGPARIYSASKTAEMLGGAAQGGDVIVNVYAPPGSKVEQRESQGPGGRSLDVIIDEAVAQNIGMPGSRTGRAMRASFAGLNPTLQGR
jgi:hypothetical protein